MMANPDPKRAGWTADAAALPLPSRGLAPPVWVVLLFTGLAFYEEGSLLGFNLAGIGWVAPLAMALLVISRDPSRIAFPAWIWLPWAILLLIHLAIVQYQGLDQRVFPLQRTVQLLSPLLVGMAISTLRPDSEFLRAFVWWMRILAVVLIGVVLHKLRAYFTAGFGDYSGMAAQMITILLLCSLFANRFLLFRQKLDLLFWGAMLLLPVINVTRMVILAALLSFPLALGPLRLIYRLAMLGGLALVGQMVFYLPRVQRKMFFSGQGKFSDLFSSDFATSGRSYMWEGMFRAAADAPWFGRGTGAGENLTYRLTGNMGYPHNDWLLTYFDYGLLGVGVFSCCLLLAVWHAWKQARGCQGETRLLLLAGSSAFLPFILLMFTDNILVYASFFGNLHFTILGLAYGALRVQAAEGVGSASVAAQREGAGVRPAFGSAGGRYG